MGWIWGLVAAIAAWVSWHLLGAETTSVALAAVLGWLVGERRGATDTRGDDLPARGVSGSAPLARPAPPPPLTPAAGVAVAASAPATEPGTGTWAATRTDAPAEAAPNPTERDRSFGPPEAENAAVERPGLVAPAPADSGGPRPLPAAIEAHSPAVLGRPEYVTSGPPAVPAGAPINPWLRESLGPFADEPAAAASTPFPNESTAVLRPGGLPVGLERLLSSDNWPIKVGVVLLLIGVGSGLKYLYDLGWLRVPIGARLLLVAVLALAALAFGWHERTRRRTFALSVQGGALGVLMMVVYAAYWAYGLLSPGVAFTGLVLLVGAGVALALVQRAQVLAALALLAGFAAPLLCSIGLGSPWTLLGYYLVLNLGVFVLGLKHGWRAVQLIGFFATFAASGYWGAHYYVPAYRAQVEPFIAIFFLLYLILTVAHARRDVTQGRAVDPILLFGVPVAAALMEAGVRQGESHWLGGVAVAVGTLYGGLWAWLRHRDDPPLLARGFAVLAVAFYAAAVPLWFGATLTAVLLAAQGSGVIWIGIRQALRIPRVLGASLHLLAGVAWIAGLFDDPGWPDWDGGDFYGALLIALSAGLASALCQRQARRSLLGVLLLLWALMFWTLAGLGQLLDRWPEHFAAGLVAWLGLSALAFALAARFGRWYGAATPALSVLLATVLWVLFASLDADGQPFAGRLPWGWAVYFGAGLLGLGVLRSTERALLPWAHGGLLLGAAVLFSIGLNAAASARPELGSGWGWAFAVLPWLVVLIALDGDWNGIGWPLQRDFAARRERLRAVAAVVVTGLLLASLASAGRADPWPYLPLANPLEFAQATALLLLWRVIQDRPGVEQRRTFAGVLAILAVVSISVAALRLVHHWGNVPWGAGIVRSMAGQAALSITWGALGLGAMLYGHARGLRAWWLKGALLMALVVLKLALIDRAYLGNVAGIVAFLGVGGLLAVVGYFAPAPPRTEAAAPGGSDRDPTITGDGR